MPPHPLHASINHVIESLTNNIILANKAGLTQQVHLDAQHALFLSQLLNDYLLYDNSYSLFDYARFGEYFDSYFPKYAQYSQAPYLKNLEVGLDFFRRAVDARGN